jgi:hypothetical protein
LVVEKLNCSAENGRVSASGARRRLAATGSGIGHPYITGQMTGILALAAHDLQGRKILMAYQPTQVCPDR